MPGVTSWNANDPSSFVTTVRGSPTGFCKTTVALGIVSLLLSTTLPRILPVLVFGASVDCADAGTTRFNPPARAMSRNMRVRFRSSPKSECGEACLLLCVVDIFLASGQGEVNCDLGVD